VFLYLNNLLGQAPSLWKVWAAVKVANVDTAAAMREKETILADSKKHDDDTYCRQDGNANAGKVLSRGVGEGRRPSRWEQQQITLYMYVHHVLRT